MSLPVYTFSARNRYAPRLHARICGPRESLWTLRKIFFGDVSSCVLGCRFMIRGRSAGPCMISRFEHKSLLCERKCVFVPCAKLTQKQKQKWFIAKSCQLTSHFLLDLTLAFHLLQKSTRTIVIWDSALWFWSVIKTIMTDWLTRSLTHAWMLDMQCFYRNTYQISSIFT